MLSICAALNALMPAQAQEDVAQFYRGKTLTIYIGSSSGGGFDTYACLLARFMSRYIAGAPKNGTAMAAIFPNVILDSVLGDRTQQKSDPSKFNYIGSGARDTYICIVRADAQVKKFTDLFSHKLVVGVTTGGAPHAIIHSCSIRCSAHILMSSATI